MITKDDKTPEIISRAKAVENGFTLYFTGKPCVRGMVAYRLVNGSRCTCWVCRLADQHRNRKAAKTPESLEKSRARQKAWRAENIEHARKNAAEYVRKKRAENPQRFRDNVNKWARENPGHGRAAWHNRRARKISATPPWFGEFDELVMIEAARLARRRQDVTGFPWHVDHMVPLKARDACGLHVAANIQVIPAVMNTTKGNRMVFAQPGEWVRHG